MNSHHPGDLALFINPVRLILIIIAMTLMSRGNAQPAGATGMVEGRVADRAAGTYLGNARVTIGGTLETFTDAFGYYRFAVVPAGTVKVRAFYTGFAPQEKDVTVTGGQRATVDFALGGQGRDNSDPNAPVQLDAFVVASTRDMSAAALAVNEQRFTQNIKTVVATESFGDVADGNVGEFVKFLPGVSLGFSD